MVKFWLPLGLLSLSLGIIGIVLPVLPTTPFVLFSAWCFARSSPRLSRWLSEHRLFGSMIRQWEEQHCISGKTKAVALSSIVVFGGSSLLFFVPPGWPFWLTCSLLGIGAFTVFRLPTCPKL